MTWFQSTNKTLFTPAFFYLYKMCNLFQVLFFYTPPILHSNQRCANIHKNFHWYTTLHQHSHLTSNTQHMHRFKRRTLRRCPRERRTWQETLMGKGIISSSLMVCWFQLSTLFMDGIYSKITKDRWFNISPCSRDCQRLSCPHSQDEIIYMFISGPVLGCLPDLLKINYSNIRTCCFYIYLKYLNS